VAAPVDDDAATQTWGIVEESNQEADEWHYPESREAAYPAIRDIGYPDPRESGYPGYPSGGSQGVVPRGQPGDEDTGLRVPVPRSARAVARRRGTPRRKASMRTVLLSGVAVLVVAALGATVFVYLNHAPSTPSPAQSQASHDSASAPVTATPSSTLGKYGHIDSRATDPVPLTLTELFPASFSVRGGATFNKTTQGPATDCAKAVFGAQLQAAARANGCTQAMRASYLSADGKLMGTIGVLNLSTAAAARKVGTVTGSNQFIGPLSAPHGPTRNLSKGTGIVEAEAKGHYLILIWAEFANLHTPSSTSDKRQLVRFAAALVSGTANVSLTSRMVTGQPTTP